jgi:hypothetical protein
MKAIQILQILRNHEVTILDDLDNLVTVIEDARYYEVVDEILKLHLTSMKAILRKVEILEDTFEKIKAVQASK